LRKFTKVESAKWLGNIYAPVKRKIAAVNEELESNPKLTNQDCYRKGYRFKIKPDDMAELNNLLNSKIFKGTSQNFGKRFRKFSILSFTIKMFENQKDANPLIFNVFQFNPFLACKMLLILCTSALDAYLKVFSAAKFTCGKAGKSC